MGFVLVRLMQAMGAYGYRGFFERKRRFLESVPHAARTLDQLLTAGLPIALPELERVFRHIAARWAGPLQQVAPPSGLVVLIRSFSFRDGYPPDGEGHGGGFVFDCRALPNPHHAPALARPLVDRRAGYRRFRTVITLRTDGANVPTLGWMVTPRSGNSPSPRMTSRTPPSFSIPCFPVRSR